MCLGILRTLDELRIDNTIINKVGKRKRNLAIAFYNYQKAYGMVRHDWIIRVCH